MMNPGTAAISQEPSAVVSTTTATALPSRKGEIGTTTAVQALNPSSVVKNNDNLGSATVAFVGTPAGTVPRTAAAEAAPSVTLINNVPPGSVVLPPREGKALNAVSPPASSNAIIQTSSLSIAVSSSSCTVISSSSTGKVEPTMALLGSPIHTAGSAAAPVSAATWRCRNIVIDPSTNLQSLPAAAAASVATVGSGVSFQGSFVNNQPDSSMPATASIQVMESESPKTIVQAVSQQHTLTTNGQSTTGVNKTMEEIRQGGIPKPSRILPPPPPTGMAKGPANTVAQSLLKPSTATTGGTPASHLLAKPQNPTKIQKVRLPPGMVLIQCENGQLFMITQQTLAQMQVQTQSKHQNIMPSCPATTTSGPPVQKSMVQAPGIPIIVQQVTQTTTIKQVPQAQKRVQLNTLQPAPLQHSPAVQPGIAVGDSAQTKQPGTPQVAEQGAKTISAATTEAMENWKKCKNFLSTLIKLISSGKQSTETAAKVKELVQNLLDGKIEAEDFTSSLYRELNSSPQPYLLPFLKNSLPALRQLTPDSAAFIQQSQQQQPRTQATTALTTVVLSSSVQSTAGKTAATVTGTGALLQPVVQQTQGTPVSVGSQGQPTLLVMQQPAKAGALKRPLRVTVKQPPNLALRQPHNRLILTTPQQTQVNQLKTIPAVKPPLLPGPEVLSTVSVQTTAVQKNKPKEPGAGSFGNNDDINDVTFMAGVNLSEESARILATHSELVGTLARSCQEETFLLSAPLQRRILELAKKHEITELHPDVVSYVSLATQQRLQNLLEKVSAIAQHKHISYKDDERYEQTSDVRAQLRFFEQLDQIAKRRKEEQEREMLMRAATSRKEDPEQLRLKQRAKELLQQELAQKRQRDADLTALEAIGPRRKKKMNSLESGSGTEGSSKNPAGLDSSGVGTARQFIPQRKIRVNLRDLIFCLENERETRHSRLLYKAFLK